MRQNAKKVVMIGSAQLRLLVILISIVFVSNVYAQFEKRYRPPKKSRTVEENLRLAEDLYRGKHYYAAIEYFEKALQEDPENVTANYKLGEIDRALRLYKTAVLYYGKVVNSPNASQYELAPFWYAKMLKADGNYEKSKEAFEDFVENYSGSNTTYLDEAKKEMESYEVVEELKMKAPQATSENVGDRVNEKLSDFAAIDYNKNTLYFTGATIIDAKQKENLSEVSEEKIEIDSVYVSRIFSIEKDSSSWGERALVNISPNENIANIGTPSLSPDGKRLYYTICEEIETGNNCNIYYSNKEGGDKWSVPIKMNEPINISGFSSKHPMIIEDEKEGAMIFYTSNRLGGSGGFDIWFCKVDSAGNIGTPSNMGASINTAKDEVSPFYDYRKGVLYFSSNGHIGLGELDIFIAKFTFETKDGKIFNLGQPMNSSADDYYFYLSDGGLRGYFSSNRLGGYSKNSGTCCDDIYSFKFDNNFDFEKLETMATEVALIEEEDDMGFFEEDFLYKKLQQAESELTLLDEEDVDPLSDEFLYKKLRQDALALGLMDEEDIEAYIDEERAKLNKLKTADADGLNLTDEDDVETSFSDDEFSLVDIIKKYERSSMRGEGMTYDELLKKYGDYRGERLSFKVQVGALRYASPTSYNYLEKTLGTIKKENTSGYTKYLIGNFDRLNEAEALRLKARQSVNDAFVAVYQGKDRIAILVK